MSAMEILSPQLMLNARMLYFAWVPADPDACSALLPSGLSPAKNRAVFINQHVVDSDEQTSHLGAYSLTYMGLDLDGTDAGPDIPGRYWLHYWSSNSIMVEYKAQRGVPAEQGRTTLELAGESLVVTTFVDDSPLICTTVRVGSESASVARGHLRYNTQEGGELMSRRYAFISEPVTPFEVQSIEILDPNHPVTALRPRTPLEVTFGLYSPRSSFCYFGGAEAL